MYANLSPLTAVVPVLLASLTHAQKAEDLVGIHRTRPDLLPSLVRDRILDPRDRTAEIHSSA